jgi:hypothetical protein
MKYLSDFALFEDGFKTPSGLFTLSKEEIEQLPSFKRMKKYQQAMLKLCPGLTGRVHFFPGRAYPVHWQDNPTSEGRGIRTFELAIAYYPFRINPSTGNISFGAEKINKNFDLDLSSPEGWDRAVYEIGLYSIARYFDIPFPTIKNLEKDPKKILKFLSTGELGGKNSNAEVTILTAGYVIGDNNKINQILADLIKSDFKFTRQIFDIPNLNIGEILRMAGFTEDEAASLLTSHKIGLF